MSISKNLGIQLLLGAIFCLSQQIATAEPGTITVGNGNGATTIPNVAGSVNLPNILTNSGAVGNVSIGNLPAGINLSSPSGAGFSTSSISGVNVTSAGSINASINVPSQPPITFSTAGSSIALSNTLPNLPNFGAGIRAPQVSNVTVPQVSPQINIPVPANTSNRPTATNNLNLPSVLNLGVPTDRIRWGIHFNRRLDGLQKANGRHAAKTLKTMNGAGSFRPVASTTPAMTLPNLTSINKEGFSVRHDGTAEITPLSSQEIKAGNGAFIFVAHHPSVIRSGERTVFLDAGTIAHIAVSADSFVVRTLLDKQNKKVRVQSLGKEFHLAAGTELCLGRDERTALSTFNDGLRAQRQAEHDAC